MGRGASELSPLTDEEDAAYRINSIVRSYFCIISFPASQLPHLDLEQHILHAAIGYETYNSYHSTVERHSEVSKSSKRLRHQQPATFYSYGLHFRHG